MEETWAGNRVNTQNNKIKKGNKVKSEGKGVRSESDLEMVKRRPGMTRLITQRKTNTQAKWVEMKGKEEETGGKQGKTTRTPKRTPKTDQAGVRLAAKGGEGPKEKHTKAEKQHKNTRERRGKKGGTGVPRKTRRKWGEKSQTGE